MSFPFGSVILFFFVGYALGSIPFGFVLTKFAGLEDIRKTGSGNIGATNVLRTGHKGLALGTLLGDALKATCAILLARCFSGEYAALAAAIGAFLGHIFSIFLNFKGGKGVATYIGILLGLNYYLLFFFAAIWLFMAFVFRYSSLAALTALLICPLVAFLVFHNPLMGIVLLFLSALSLWRHKDNIKRLLDKSETKIGQHKKAETMSEH